CGRGSAGPGGRAGGDTGGRCNTGSGVPAAAASQGCRGARNKDKQAAGLGEGDAERLDVVPVQWPVAVADDGFAVVADAGRLGQAPVGELDAVVVPQHVLGVMTRGAG